MDRITQEQTPGSEAGNTTRLGAYPYITLIDTDAMYEITLQWRIAFCGPCRKTVCPVIIDVNTEQRTDQQMIIRRYRQA